MCDPVSLTIAATAVSAAGTIFGGIQQSQMHRYEAGITQNNAIYADRQAADALERGKQAQVDHFRKVAALKGQQTAAFAAEGVDVGFGSPLDVLGDTAVMGMEDAFRLAENANREAQGYRIEAQNYRAQRSASKAAATNTLISTAFDTASTILGGASQVGAGIGKYGAPSWMGRSSTPSWVGARIGTG